ncbi:MAG: terminase, partial [Schwartzia sp.]|nr:terminase [Schwartzia sp. (in: firmicutes)]
VNPTMLQQYAMSVSRWIQCEEILSEFGFLAKHPTTGAAIASPYVAMSQQYMKQVNQIWYQIYQIVKENCSVDYQGANPQDDVMERLLRARRGV